MLMFDGQPSATASLSPACLLPSSAAEALCLTLCSLVSHSAVLLMPACHMTPLCCGKSGAEHVLPRALLCLPCEPHDGAIAARHSVEPVSESLKSSALKSAQ